MERFTTDRANMVSPPVYFALTVDKAVRSFAEKWFLDFDGVKYEALHFRDGELANESKLKDSADYTAYKAAAPDAMAKFKFRKAMIDDFKEKLMAEVAPLLG